MLKSRLILLVVLFFGLTLLNAQEFKAEVIVDAQQTGNNQLSVFKTLQQQLTEFINNNTWSSYDLDDHQKIECSFFLLVKSFKDNQFTATLQIQASRPIYGTDQSTPIFNFKDNNLSFTYKEFQVFEYSPNTYVNNLISTIAFYLKTILGLDADSFETSSGTDFYKEANQIVNFSQQRGSGWQVTGNNNTRGVLNRDLLSANFSNFRSAFYNYHRQGLDQFYQDSEAAKAEVVKALNTIKKVNDQRPNSILIRSFFDAKANEILEVFSGGDAKNHQEMQQLLLKVAPIHSRSWRKIKS